VRTTLLLLAVIFGAFPALAAESVFAGAASRGGVAPALADKVAEALADSFADQGVVPLLGSASADGATGGDSAEQITRLLDDTRGRYLEGDFDGAISQAERASKRFEESAAFDTDDGSWKAWTEVMLVRALALSKSGKKKAADKVLSALASVRPDYIPDPGLAPPKFASRYQELLAERQKLKLKLSATSRPAGATVILDGVEVGVTPWESNGVLPGRHFVSLRLGNERHDEAVTMKRGAAEVRAELGDPRGAAAKSLLRELSQGLTEAALISTASDLGDDVLLAIVEPGDESFELLIGHVRGGALVSVTGARAQTDLADLPTIAGNLALTAFESDVDSWLDGSDAAELRTRFLKSAGMNDDDDDGGGGGGDEEGGGGLGVALGVTAGVVGVAIVAAAIAGGVYLFLNQPPNPGGIDVVVDATNL